MSKSYYVDVPQEFCDKLQKTGYEVEAIMSIIDRMFQNHKEDKDASLFESVPWKHYMKQFEELNGRYSEEKNELNKYLSPIIREKEGISDDDTDFSFYWNIEDFYEKRARITIH